MSASSALVLLLVAILWGSAWIWLLLLARLARGEPWIRYQPRRPVPWNGWELFAFAIFYLLLPGMLMAIAKWGFGLEMPARAAIEKGAADSTEHPIGQLLLGEHSPWVAMLCAMAVIVVAPLAEEFLFRLLFQGWMERAEHRRRRRQMRALHERKSESLAPLGPIPTSSPSDAVPSPEDSQNPFASPGTEKPVSSANLVRAQRRVLPIGTVPVLISSFLFAAVHFRFAKSEESFERLIFAITLLIVASLLVVAGVTAYLRVGRSATWADLGVVPDKLGLDVALGTGAYLAICPVVYFVMLAVKLAVPQHWVVDPIPLFILALALGYLYYRTHRIVPSIVLHALFNGTAVALALAAKGAV